MSLIRLDEYCESVRDGTHDTPKPTEEGKFLITSKAINNDTVDYSSAYYISEDDYNAVNKRSKVDRYDVLMTMIGSVGRLHFVDYEPDYAIKNIALFKVGDYYKAKWLYYYLSSNNVQNYLEAVANGTSQHFVGLGYLRKFKIENISERNKKIVDILTKYDNLIKLNNNRIKLLEQTAQEIYKEWFVRFRFPGYEKEKFEHGIPKDWEYERLNTIIDYDRGISYSSEDIDTDSGINLINLGNIIGYGGFKKEGSKQYQGKYKPEQTVNNHDLIMGITDMTQDRRTVGYVGLVEEINESISVISMDLIKLKSDLSNYYLYCLFTYGGVSKYISQYANGTNVLHLRPADALKAKILLPKEDIIKMFSDLVEHIFKEINQLNKENDNLIKQRDYLLPRLMSGKLEV